MFRLSETILNKLSSDTVRNEHCPLNRLEDSVCSVVKWKPTNRLFKQFRLKARASRAVVVKSSLIILNFCFTFCQSLHGAHASHQALSCSSELQHIKCILPWTFSNEVHGEIKPSTLTTQWHTTQWLTTQWLTTQWHTTQWLYRFRGSAVVQWRLLAPRLQVFQQRQPLVIDKSFVARNQCSFHFFRLEQSVRPANRFSLNSGRIWFSFVSDSWISCWHTSRSVLHRSSHQTKRRNSCSWKQNKTVFRAPMHIYQLSEASGDCQRSIA
jgi:hypothetical protein